jgi:hypothetical protein
VHFIYLLTFFTEDKPVRNFVNQTSQLRVEVVLHGIICPKQPHQLVVTVLLTFQVEPLKFLPICFQKLCALR